jgi:hypothetical protein
MKPEGKQYGLAGVCWRPQEWILQVGLQSLKIIHKTSIHRSDQQVGLESRKTAIKLHRSAQQNKTKGCNMLLSMNYANHRSDDDIDIYLMSLRTRILHQSMILSLASVIQ